MKDINEDLDGPFGALVDLPCAIWEEIPGHFKAVTLRYMFLWGILSYGFSGIWQVTFFLEVAVLGSACWELTVYIKQYHDPKQRLPTKIERWMAGDPFGPTTLSIYLIGAGLMGAFRNLYR